MSFQKRKHPNTTCYGHVKILQMQQSYHLLGTTCLNLEMNDSIDSARSDLEFKTIDDGSVVFHYSSLPTLRLFFSPKSLSSHGKEILK